MKATINSLLCSTRATNAGFTLIELMVTIAVMAIIVSIAAPNISTQLANQRVKSTTATLANALKEARVESVIRRQEIEVSYDNDGSNSGAIKIEDASSNIIATYQYNAKSTITTDDSDIKFKPNKMADEINYKICDSNIVASAREIKVNEIGNITNKLGGTCP